MELKVLSLLLYLTALFYCGIEVYGNVPFRGDCKKEATFKKSDHGKSLVGHVIASHDFTSPIDCAVECLTDRRCTSYNYQETGSPLHKCELNNQTKASASSDFVDKPGYLYYDAKNFVLSVCATSPCRNGGTCHEACEGSTHECACLPGFAGENCETWEGSDGSSSSSPGRSCLQINKFGLSRGDKRYWIRPVLSGSPFTVYCDMTTDGGGWTQVKKIVLSSSSVGSTTATTDDYRQMTNLPRATIITTVGLINLKRDMGYDQIRYYCRKAARDKVFHIMTKRTSLGYAALRYLVESPTPLCTACNSFTRLPDDTSALSRNCAKWGYVNGRTLQSKWGHTSYQGSHRTWHRFAHWHGVRTVSFTANEYWCDDHDRSTIRSGDTWIMFVR